MSSKNAFSEESQPFDRQESGLGSVDYTNLKVDSAGRVVIPADMRAAMMVKPGETISARVVDGEFRIVSPQVALKQVQAFARKWKAEHPDEKSVVDELIADRREEARREDERFRRLDREADEAADKAS